MNPHQQNKIDVNSLTPDEQRLLRMYGKIPNKKDLLQNKLKERKYFDSGDYALSKAGKASDVGVTSIGSRHPLPENIPHLTATSPPQGNAIPNHFNGHAQGHPHSGSSHNGLSSGMSRSPAKEGSFLHRETNVDDESGGKKPSNEHERQQQVSKEDSSAMTEEQNPKSSGEGLSVSPPKLREGLPIRR